MARRTKWPVRPIRWIHRDRPGHRTVQHVLAHGDPGRAEAYRRHGVGLIETLCTKSFVHPGMQRSVKPKITVEPDAGLDVCPLCMKALDSLMRTPYLGDPQ